MKGYRGNIKVLGIKYWVIEELEKSSGKSNLHLKLILHIPVFLSAGWFTYSFKNTNSTQADMLFKHCAGFSMLIQGINSPLYCLSLILLHWLDILKWWSTGLSLHMVPLHVPLVTSSGLIDVNSTYVPSTCSVYLLWTPDSYTRFHLTFRHGFLLLLLLFFIFLRK